MTALGHLRKLIYPRHLDSRDNCAYCHEDATSCAPDCPWVAAKGFVEEQDNTLTAVIGDVRIPATNVRFDPDRETIEDAVDPSGNDERRAIDALATFTAIERKLHELRGPRAFTLIEILVVLVIIVLVSAVALPSIINALSHRQVSEAARSLQAVLAGARDAAIRDNAQGGIRLIADPTTPGAYSRIIPLSQPPGYYDGLTSIVPANAPYPATVLLGTTALVLEESPYSIANGVKIPNEPTSWAWNVRAGDRIQINNAGPWLTVCGPIVTANPESFINYGAPGTASPLGHDYLLLTNGYDDDQNGWIDEGWDGVDNNGDGNIDESAEWEQETWRGSLAAGVTDLPYTIRRRPIPGSNARQVDLPTNIVIDQSRSNLPAVTDLVCSPTGQWSPSLMWGVPSSITLGGNWLQFWLGERADMGVAPKGEWFLVSVNGATGRVSSTEAPDLVTGLATARQSP